MVNIECRVVVQRGRSRKRVPRKIEVVLACVFPPGLERLLVVVGAVSVVMKSQTETCSGQSKWPDFGVLSMTTDWGSEPLAAKVVGDPRVRPGERVFPVVDHRERSVPTIVG